MRRSKEQWLALFDEQDRSGLSIVAFCHQQNINPKYFYNRRSLLKTQQAQLSCFVRAQVTEPVVVSDDIGQALIIQYGKASLQLPPSTSVSRLVEIMEALS